jgi:hypothetical protein
MTRKSNNSKSLNDLNRCTHNTRNGRCRMPATDSAASFCSEHARQEETHQQTPDPETLAAELLGELEDFSTADAVNHFLGNLVKQLARKRIARLDAIALAYLCQLLLNSLPPMWKEIEEERDIAAGHELLQSLAREHAARLAEQQSPEPTTVQTNPS